MGNCSNISNTQTVTLDHGTLTSGFCHNSLQTTYEEFIDRTTGSLGGNMAAFTAGDDTPASGDQDKLWMKQNASTCVPEGWQWYNGSSSAWEAVSTPLSTVGSGAIGEVLYHNGTNWVVLSAGTDGQHLKSKGAAAPEWADVVVPTVTVAADSTALDDDAVVTVPANTFLIIGTLRYNMSGSKGAKATAQIKDSSGTVLDTVDLGGGNELEGTDGGSGMSVRDSFSIGVPSTCATVRIYKGTGTNSMTGEVTQFVKLS
jgi:hypothetical protein